MLFRSGTPARIERALAPADAAGGTTGPTKSVMPCISVCVPDHRAVQAKSGESALSLTGDCDVAHSIWGASSKAERSWTTTPSDSVVANVDARLSPNVLALLHWVLAPHTGSRMTTQRVDI